MSIKSLNWAFQQKVGNPIRKSILITIADWSADHGQPLECTWRSYESIAERVECCVRSVENHVKELERLGFVKIEHRFCESGKQTSSNIFILMNEETGPAGDSGTPRRRFGHPPQEIRTNPKIDSSKKKRARESENLDWKKTLNPSNNTDECKWSDDGLKIEVSGNFEKSLLEMACGDRATLNNWLLQAAAYVGENLSGLAMQKSVSAQIARQSQRKVEIDRKYPGYSPAEPTQEVQSSRIEPVAEDDQERAALAQMRRYGLKNREQVEEFRRKIGEYLARDYTLERAKTEALKSVREAKNENKSHTEGSGGVPPNDSSETSKPSQRANMAQQTHNLISRSIKKPDRGKKHRDLTNVWASENEAQSRCESKPIINSFGDSDYLLNTGFLRGDRS